ncbi:MAG: polysaccharide deacetylase family protein [Ilumatobacteraceae bacterium]
MTSPVITLTFDNGPTPGITESVLDVLAQHGAVATFFAIGQKLATPAGQALGKRIVNEGHLLGGHTWSHAVQFGVADEARIVDELASTRDAVEGAGGEALLFRPYGAGGVIDDRLMSPFGVTTLCSQGYTCVLWNVLPGDWRDADGWVAHAMTAVEQRQSSVLVLHDIADAALPRLDEFLTAARSLDASWSHDFPDDCTPIRSGAPTSSFGTLCSAT